MSKDRSSVVALTFLILGGCTEVGGSSSQIPFHADADLLSAFEWDSGFLPEASAAQVRVVARGSGGSAIDARATADGSVLTPTAGSGQLAVGGGLTLEVHAKVDVGSIHYEGVVQEVGYEVPAASVAFDPFMLEGLSTTATSALPEGELLRAPIPSVPGSTLVLSIVGGEVQSTFAGACAASGGGLAHYLGSVTMSGTVELAATVEIEVPIVGSRSFGPFAITVPIPALEREVDLGLFEVSSGTRLESGPSPCDPSTQADGGIIGGADGSVATRDGAVPPGTDAGTRVCAAPLMRTTGELCDYATRECVEGAIDNDEFNACMAADAAPTACEECIVREVQSCWSQQCPAAYQTYACCVLDRCSTLEGDRRSSCIDAFCVDERDAFRACSRTTTCDITEHCFRRPR